jgi:hypothetical protein
MSVYTVHEPPLRAADVVPDPERFVFVREGFYVWAFLLATLWMLRHRMWLVLAIYVVVALGIEIGLRYAGVSGFALAIVGLLISFFVGIEASTLRRFTLARRGWKNVGVVSGDDLEDAERRFFDAWCRSRSSPRAPPPAAPALLPPPQPTQSPDIVGLFPDPSAHR